MTCVMSYFFSLSLPQGCGFFMLFVLTYSCPMTKVLLNNVAFTSIPIILLFVFIVAMEGAHLNNFRGLSNVTDFDF